MNLKTYILFDYDDSVEGCIKMKIVKGFTRDNIKNALNVKTGWQATGSDKLYFFPGCSVPRFKVREKFSCTNKPSSATAAFISDNLEGSDTSFDFYPKCMPVDINEWRPFMNQLIDDKIPQRFEMFYQNNTIEKIFLSKKLWYDRYWSTYFTGTGISLSSHLSNRWSFKYDCMSLQENQLIGLSNSPEMRAMTCDVYMESDILKVLNENQFVIDEVKYNELRAFGNSGDSENLVLMMELMSNCDYDKSIVHLLFLLKEFGDDIGNLKEAQHVNFRSLLTFLDLDLKELSNLDINKLTATLRKQKKFTRANAQLVSSLCSEDYINYSNSDNLCWTQGPVLKKECLELLQDDTDN